MKRWRRWLEMLIWMVMVELISRNLLEWCWLHDKFTFLRGVKKYVLKMCEKTNVKQIIIIIIIKIVTFLLTHIQLIAPTDSGYLMLGQNPTWTSREKLFTFKRFWTWNFRRSKSPNSKSWLLGQPLKVNKNFTSLSLDFIIKYYFTSCL